MFTPDFAYAAQVDPDCCYGEKGRTLRGLTLVGPERAPSWPTGPFPVMGHLAPVTRFLTSVVLVGALISATSCASPTAGGTTWSAMPQSIACRSHQLSGGDESLNDQLPLPAAAQIDQVTLSHPGEARLELSFDLPQGPPPQDAVYRIVVLPGSQKLRGWNVPTNPVAVIVHSPNSSSSRWTADAVGLDRPNQETLLSATTSGHAMDIVLNLDGQSKLLETGPFKPEIAVSVHIGAHHGTHGIACTWEEPPTSANSSTSGGGTVAAVPTDAQQPSTSPAPEPRYQPAPPPTAPTTVSDADSHGFIGNYLARCLDVDPAVAIGRTNNSLLVICQSQGGTLYYKGMGLQNQQGVYIDGVARTSSGFTVTNNGVQYTITRNELQINQGGSTLADEPMTAYWSQ